MRTRGTPPRSRCGGGARNRAPWRRCRWGSWGAILRFSLYRAQHLPFARSPRGDSLPSAADFDDRARDVGRLLREEPGDGPWALVGVAGALQRNSRAQALEAVGLAARRVQIGVDQSGRDAVDADAIGRQLAREPLGEAVHG